MRGFGRRRQRKESLDAQAYENKKAAGAGPAALGNGSGAGAEAGAGAYFSRLNADWRRARPSVVLKLAWTRSMRPASRAFLLGSFTS